MAPNSVYNARPLYDIVQYCITLTNITFECIFIHLELYYRFISIINQYSCYSRWCQIILLLYVSKILIFIRHRNSLSFFNNSTHHQSCKYRNVCTCSYIIDFSVVPLWWILVQVHVYIMPILADSLYLLFHHSIQTAKQNACVSPILYLNTISNITFMISDII